MRKLLTFTLGLLLVGCSTMRPARYSISVDNNQALKRFQGASVQLASITSSAEFDARCRLVGPIEGPDGMSIPEFVRKAFDDELKLAGIYSTTGVALRGTLTKLAFSSGAPPVSSDGWWDLGLSLASSNGRVMAVENRYTFDLSAWGDGSMACDKTAQALGPAVQDLIRKFATDNRFGQLLGR